MSTTDVAVDTVAEDHVEIPVEDELIEPQAPTYYRVQTGVVKVVEHFNQHGSFWMYILMLVVWLILVLLELLPHTVF
jgi:hypothetical protein